MIKPGQPILLWEPKSSFLIAYEASRRLDTHRGFLILPERLSYGQAVETSTGQRFWALVPSLSELSMKVKRTTTILYPKDIGYLIMETGISSGQRVLEVGTGSGALTLVLASMVGEDGKVYSFERRPEFLENAKKNVEKWGLGDRVEFIQRDPAEQGFGISDISTAIIDVPEPWTIVGPAREAIGGGGFWASLSPCIEQVIRVTEELEGAGFVATKTIELLEREILIRPGKTRPRERMISHTGYLTVARKTSP
ncbi:MAG: tRNA (adenine-N1)-methyltransferase [candidate division WOR-3 bacterium]